MREDEDGTPVKRGPGRLKEATNKRPELRSKQYDLRSSKKQLPDPIVVKPSSDDDIKWHDLRYALFAGKISVFEAVLGPDAAKWKDAIYEEIKNLVANDPWELVERPKDVNVVECRTSLKNKHGANGKLERRKARVVAKGYS